ncbi:MAG: 8-oxo-dGTP diphosphatase [Thermoleophilia bacterium]
MSDRAVRPLVGTLVYVLDRPAGRVLMVHRNARPQDDHLGKFNGLGGKLERDEDVVSAAVREVREEAGITLTHLELRGTITWSGFGPRREDWLGFVFLADAWDGTAWDSGPEGSLEWVALDRLRRACSDDPRVRADAGLPMWDGDRHFLPLVLDDDPRQFHGTMPYDVDRPLDWRVVRP